MHFFRSPSTGHFLAKECPLELSVSLPELKVHDSVFSNIPQLFSILSFTLHAHLEELKEL